jgi:hypothetical protein
MRGNAAGSSNTLGGVVHTIWREIMTKRVISKHYLPSDFNNLQGISGEGIV